MTTDIPGTSAEPPATKAPTNSAPPAINLQTVDWSNTTIPGTVCHLPTPVTLHDGEATVAAPASLHAGTTDIAIGAALPPTFGDLLGSGTADVAAIRVACSNTGGTADGQLADNWVIFEATASGPQAIGVLSPQQPSAQLVGHVPYFDPRAGIVISPGSLTVQEVWYGPSDSTCCASGLSTTTWTYSAGRFSPSTVVTRSTAPIPTFSDAASWPTFTDHSALAGLVGLNPQTNQAEFVIDCGPDVNPGIVIVNLSGLIFEEDTNPNNLAAGSVVTVTLKQWEHDAAHDGWSGYIYLNQTPPRISNAPGSYSCQGGKITGSTTG